MTNRNIIIFIITLCLTALAPAPKSQALELIMLEQDLCEWCEQWHEDIGGIYHKTDEGKRAPLVKINIHDKLPQKYKDVNLGIFTPTFILWDNGKEVGRIRGYPGEDFFWGLLGELLKKHDTKAAATQ